MSLACDSVVFNRHCTMSSYTYKTDRIKTHQKALKNHKTQILSRDNFTNFYISQKFFPSNWVVKMDWESNLNLTGL